MGKRSDFAKRPNDKYLTPYAPVVPLVPYLAGLSTFAEPCAGDGRLVRHIERHGLRCVHARDIAPESLFVARGDALTDDIAPCDAIITNPPWSRHLLHPMIDRFMRIAPTWLLFDADWKQTGQRGEVARLMRHCSHIVAVGRVKWIEGSKMTGKDNCAWYRFDVNHVDGAKFYPKVT